MLLDNLRQSLAPDFSSKLSNISRLSDKECQQLTGLTKCQFNSLKKKLKTLKNSIARDKSQALATYLFWLKTGLPYRTIAALFSLDNFQTVGEYCEQARNSLVKDFVPHNLGPNHITRKEWIKHNTKIATELLGIKPNEFAIISDGTYLYCQKSRDNTFQKKTWSVQKKSNLVKPFVLCSTDGYIIDVVGPYPAVDNDATIMQHVLKSNKELRTLIRSNDHIIIDRGFRDCVKTLESTYKLNIHMPSLIPPKQKQLSTLEANHSRFVTKCRWTVEAVNGLLKTLFRANDKTVDNKSINHSIDEYRIGAALINKYHSRLYSDIDNESLIANTMKKQFYTPNKLETVVDVINRKRKPFTEVSVESLNDFPKLEFNTIRDNITLGSYQLKQALSYLNNFDNVELFKGDSKIINPSLTLIRARIKSRHSNANTYNTYIAYKPNINSYKAIDSWYCTCKSGKRTVGTCSHIATVIYKFSYQKDNPNQSKKSLDSIFPALPYYESSETEIDSEGDDYDKPGPSGISNIKEQTKEYPKLYPNLFETFEQSGLMSKKTTTIELANTDSDND